jgi:predicted membrane channel-forming protein YqfA (hemolysin III family)
MKWIVAGWLLFIVSALFFVASAWRAGDPLALAGSIFFLIACFSFLVPIAGGKPH